MQNGIPNQELLDQWNFVLLSGVFFLHFLNSVVSTLIWSGTCFLNSMSKTTEWICCEVTALFHKFSLFRERKPIAWGGTNQNRSARAWWFTECVPQESRSSLDWHNLSENPNKITRSTNKGRVKVMMKWMWVSSLTRSCNKSVNWTSLLIWLMNQLPAVWMDESPICDLPLWRKKYDKMLVSQGSVVLWAARRPWRRVEDMSHCCWGWELWELLWKVIQMLCLLWIKGMSTLWLQTDLQ